MRSVSETEHQPHLPPTPFYFQKDEFSVLLFILSGAAFSYLW